MSYNCDDDDSVEAETVEFECVCIRETDQALLIHRDEDDFGKDWWIPKSLVRGGDVRGDGDRGTLAIPEWFAEKEGMI